MQKRLAPAIIAALLAFALLLAGCDKPSAISQAPSGAQPAASVSAEPPAASQPDDTPSLIEAEPPREVASLLDAALVEPLRGKTWLVLGDSISEPYTRTENNYYHYIAQWLELEVITVAVSGIGYRAGWPEEPPLPARVEGLPAEVDFITVFAGANDGPYPLGAFDDGNPDTFYGALHSLYAQLTEKYPTTPIGVFTPTPADTDWGEDSAYTPYTDAILQVAGHYSLPALDLYRQSGLRPWIAENNLAYFSNPEVPEGDGRHPNAAGHYILATKMLPFILFNMQSK